MRERAQRIIAAAVDLAERGGFEAVRLREVASESGVALGTVYRYFRSKEDLLAAALGQQIEAFEKSVGEGAPADASGADGVLRFFRLATDGLLARPHFARAVLRAVATAESDLTEKVSQFESRMVALVTGAIRGSGGSGEPTRRECEVALVLQRVWFAALVGWAGMLHDRDVVDAQVESAVDLLLGSADR